MTDFATDCTADIVAKLGALSPLDSQHVFSVYSEQDLVEKVKIGIKTPYAGVFYGGLRARTGDDPTRTGRMVDLQITVLYGLAGKAIGNVDMKGTAWTLLSNTRKAILGVPGTRSPTGHPWRFSNETFMGTRGDVLYYIQTWITAAAMG